MLRARLWYGPAGHHLGTERVAQYLRGPLGCVLDLHERRRDGRWGAEIELHAPVHARVIAQRTPAVSGEAADLVSRLPADAPQRLAQRLAHTTARLDFHDLSDSRFTPGAGVARSVLVPLAEALGGMVEDVENGRLLYFPFPEGESTWSRFRRSFEEMLTVLRAAR